MIEQELLEAAAGSAALATAAIHQALGHFDRALDDVRVALREIRAVRQALEGVPEAD